MKDLQADRDTCMIFRFLIVKKIFAFHLQCDISNFKIFKLWKYYKIFPESSKTIRSILKHYELCHLCSFFKSQINPALLFDLSVFPSPTTYSYDFLSSG